MDKPLALMRPFFDPDRDGWRFEFKVRAGIDTVWLPILIPEEVPESDREAMAIQKFRSLLVSIAAEAEELNR